MEGKPDPLVIGKDGLRGRLLTRTSESASASQKLLVELENGQQMQIPASLLTPQRDGSYSLDITRAELEQGHTRRTESTSQTETQMNVPVMQEEMSVEKRAIETGRVRITKQINEHEEILDEPLLRQEVKIERKEINQHLEGPPPPSRYEGDTLIVPLVEEVLVVEKRLMLKAELHIRREEKTVREPQKVTLRSEDVRVERVEPSN